MNNKVYVNPNFSNSKARNNLCQSKHKISLHVNPNFPQLLPQNTSKIFVNPNFIKVKTNTESHHNLPLQTTPSNVTTQDTAPSNSSIKPLPISQSRYSLVRNNANTGSFIKAINAEAVNVKKTSTVKISKYKSVAINNYKQNMNTPAENTEIAIPHKKSSQTSATSPVGHKLTYLRNNKHFISKYKLCKPILPVQLNRVSNIFNKSSPSNKKINYLKTRPIKCMKINNIPCPLFKKYGKCLRRLNGTCEYLHDKKHVTICRKFLKGVCHQKNCLLSHDITSNKMPTCYFYLKGLCSKDDCPYLHVKLSEKSKLCPDFLKGYCDRGQSCLNRHVHVNSNAPKLNKSNKKLLINSSRNSKPKLNNLYKVKKGTEQKLNIENKNLENVSTNLNECRYYEEVTVNASSNNENDLIRPTRCKLGSLPSFIKL